jgi:hypothetical protein
MDSRRGRFNSMRFQPGFRYGASTAVIGALALLTGETQGFAIDATAYATAAAPYTGGPAGGTVAVIDTGTPANDLSNVALDSSNLTQSGTSPKIVHFPDSPYARWTPHNYILQSQTFGTTWVATSTVTENDTTAPDGTATVDKVVDGSGTQVKQTAVTTLASVVYTASLYVKQSNITWFSFIVNSDDAFTDYLQCWFNVSAGSTGSSSANGAYTYVTHTITAAENGFYRLSITYSTTAANQGFFLCSVTADGGSTRVSSGTYWLWGAQINRGYTALPYLVTTTTARIGIPQGYDAAAAQYGILEEPAGTNLCLYSDDFTNAAWTKSNMTTAKTATGPDNGTNSASTLTATAGNATALQAITSASSARITGFWVKRRTGSGNIDLTQDNGGTWQTMTVTADWTRVELTAATLTDPTVGIRIVTSGDEIDVWGFQHETGSVLTSTIPTRGVTVTRAADNLIALSSSFPYGSSNTAYVYAVAREVATQHDVLEFDANNANEDESVKLYTDASANILMQIEDGGATQLDPLDSAVNASANTTFQISGAWATNDVDVSANGTAAASDGTATMPTITHIRFGSNPTPGNHLNGFIYKMVTVPRQVETDAGNLETWRYA